MDIKIVVAKFHAGEEVRNTEADATRSAHAQAIATELQKLTSGTRTYDIDRGSLAGTPMSGVRATKARDIANILEVAEKAGFITFTTKA